MDLPDQFDVLVLGTGLTESIIAAAASRAGKAVLHLDSHDYYGSEWTSLNFKQVDRWIKSESDDSKSLVSNIECLELFSEKWSKTELERQGNKINIDLCPRFIYSSGPMVDLLIKSNISRYLEFINCHRIYFLKEDESGYKCIPVPSSRSNVFTSKDLSIIQKRRLTKFIENYAESDLTELDEISFKKLMDDNQLDHELQVIFKTVLAMRGDECVASEAILSLRKFIKSVGRYGDTPFLWTMGGCGDIPQAFCRLSAVFGGTYCLEACPTQLKFETDHVEFNFNGSNRRATFIVGSISNIPSEYFTLQIPLKKSSYVTCLTNKSLTESEDGRASLLRMESGSDGITVIELGYSSLCVPRGLYMVHISCPSVAETSKQDLISVIEKLFSLSEDSSGKPQLIWAMFCNMSFVDGPLPNDLANLYVVDGPVLEMDYGKCINEARTVFEKMFPGEEFLPKAPDAEDIVIENVDNGTNE